MYTSTTLPFGRVVDFILSKKKKSRIQSLDPGSTHLLLRFHDLNNVDDGESKASGQGADAQVIDDAFTGFFRHNEISL